MSLKRKHDDDLTTSCFTNNKLIRFIVKWSCTDVSIDDPLLNKWLTKIAPSCVYPKMKNEKDPIFKCILCSTNCTSQQSIIRHYSERHEHQIPKNIFGNKETFKCDICYLSFKRQEHLNSHLKSLGHEKLTKVENSSIINSYNESKRKDLNRKENLKRKISTELPYLEWQGENKKSKLSIDQKKSSCEAKDTISTTSTTNTASTSASSNTTPSNESHLTIEEILNDVLENRVEESHLTIEEILNDVLVNRDEENHQSNDRDGMVRSLSDDMIRNLVFE